MIEIREIGQDEVLSQMFHTLPARLYASDPYKIPNDPDIEAGLFDPKRNPALSFCFAERWVAIMDGLCVGRIAAIVNRRWIEKTGDPIGRITRFECINDISVAEALFSAAEDWLSERGMEQIIGPLGFCNIDSYGLTTTGFDQPASFASTQSLPYYVNLWQKCGYKHLQDWNEYRINVHIQIPDRLDKTADGSEQRSDIRVYNLETDEDIEKYATEVYNLFNIAYAPHLGAFPLDEKLQKYYYDKYRRWLTPRYIIVARKNEVRNHRDKTVVVGKLVGFLVAIPSVSKALIENKDKTGIARWWGMRQSLQKTSEVEVLIGAVHPNYRRQGILSILTRHLFRQCIKEGMQVIQTTTVVNGGDGGFNPKKHFDAQISRQKRCYIKNL